MMCHDQRLAYPDCCNIHRISSVSCSCSLFSGINHYAVGWDIVGAVVEDIFECIG
jgi:hypothetical protein